MLGLFMYGSTLQKGISVFCVCCVKNVMHTNLYGDTLLHTYNINNHKNAEFIFFSFYHKLIKSV